MSTQYTVFWRFFNALCLYRAWSGASKSTVSRSLCSSYMGSTSRKDTVCRLLNFCPPGINPELMMGWKLITQPTWQVYWKKTSRIVTLSCKLGSMWLRPEWPWRARRCRIVPDESVQYWYLFLFPPPAMVFFHFSSDQSWQYKKFFWRFSFILQISIAPSSSRRRFPWRKRLISFFDTE